ncbi:hypothetical protein B0H34DRAFT_793744 [Crassisporium funariophilum]|nr:hypothetical protein B0H34DRAFT_793744 [Crassisporium funariophilum]
MLFSIALLFALPLVRAVAVPASHDSHVHDHSHDIRQSLPSSNWYHREDHPVHVLFKRAPGDGTNYDPVGSAAWYAGFPRTVPGTLPDTNLLPAAWVNALNAAVAAGKIPDIPRSTNTPQTNPVYPAGVNPNSPQVCSATYKCRNPDDIWDSPDGVFASSFDDGPQPATTKLVQFLDSNNEKTTHFMIGVNILAYPTQFSTAFDSENDIAVHTWTHPYMTTLSNLDILGQLGWTMQLIHNSTGGRVPKFWRPPYGDSDNRVRAIAKEVFGMETVIWNRDPQDWNSQAASILTSLQGWLTGPKIPGLMILEHETSDVTVDGFISAYPLIKANGWQFASLATLVGGGDVYQNAKSSSSNDVDPQGIILGNGTSSTLPNTSTSTPTTSQGGAPKADQSQPPSSQTTSSAMTLRNGSTFPALLATIAMSVMFLCS